jgi:uncharacterized protein YcbK (DUF882 family)
MIDRRKLLIGAAAAALGTGMPALAANPIVPGTPVETNTTPGCAWPPPNWVKGGFPTTRWVKIRFVHTNEKFNDIYFTGGAYSLHAVEQFSHTCRDFRANETKLLDPRLMDLLFVLHWKYCKDEIQIFSGFRSEATNAHIEGAAKNSQHIQGRALDIHLPNMDNDEVARSFQQFLYGGVGMYPGREFTHMDMGNLRRWVG